MSIFDLRIGTCGCCEPPSPGTPVTICNRASLSEIEYRVGTYPTFRRAAITLVPRMGSELLAELGLDEAPLHRWTSEQSDDYGVAFIEMWATIGDILTFYQERYANLAWLRTAPDRDSVRKLAQLLGYRLKPGRSASVHLAYTVDPETSVLIPSGSRAQSVPDEGQVPQKFECSLPLAATTSLNRVRLYGEPQTTDQLDAGRVSATLDAGSAIPNVGDRLVVFSDLQARTQEVTVESITGVDGRSVVRWSQPLLASFTRAFVAKRRFRLFGHSQPPKYFVSVETSVGTYLAWDELDTVYDVNAQTDIFLEGSVEALEAGTNVLVDNVVHHVDAVLQTSHTVAPVTGPATRLSLDTSVTGRLDEITVLELGDEITPASWQTPTVPLAASTDVYVSTSDVPVDTTIEPKRILVLDDAAGQPMVAEVEMVEEFTAVGPPGAFLRVTLKDTMTRALDHETAFMFGNVAAATHGETVRDEVVGNGDQSAARQSFELKKARVTHTADPAAVGGARNSLQIFVDRVKWAERSGLFGAAADDRVFSTSIDDDQKMTVQFGDGTAGARLSTGRANIMATYREGLGREGNLRPGQIRTALDKPVGLNAVTNPVPSEGGVEPETTDAARENAPNTVRTFDRAISLRDFADMAREYIGVAKAFATWVWDAEERVVHITVGGDDGGPVDDMDKLRDYLDLRRDPNRALRIGEYRSVAFDFWALVDVDADRFRDDVEEAVRAAVTNYFAYEHRSFGEAVHLSDLYAVVQDVPGVASLLVERLNYRDWFEQQSHGMGPLYSLVHAPIFGAIHDATTGEITPAELAVIEPPHIHLTMTGGLTS
jgi:predicted phage baseplate assembly protein